MCGLRPGMTGLPSVGGEGVALARRLEKNRGTWISRRERSDTSEGGRLRATFMEYDLDGTGLVDKEAWGCRGCVCVLGNGS